MTQDTTNKNIEEKIDSFMNSILTKTTGSYADNYSQVETFVNSLTDEEKNKFSNRIKDYFEINPYGALGFACYGRLKGLEKEVTAQISNPDTNIQIAAIQTVRALNMRTAYPKLRECYQGSQELKDNLLVTMFLIQPNETLGLIQSRLDETPENFFLLSNLYLICLESTGRMKRDLIDNICRSKDIPEQQLEIAYDKAFEMYRS